MIYSASLPTPIGTLLIKSDGDAVNSISFGSEPEEELLCPLLAAAKQQFVEYFNGKRNDFDFPILQSGTEFQQTVWKELLKINIGAPISYTTLSKRMNNPLAIRAIASANGKNKLMIVIPCHRVIGSKGELVGYAGELWRKKWLLEHEARMMNIRQSCLSF